MLSKHCETCNDTLEDNLPPPQKLISRFFGKNKQTNSLVGKTLASSGTKMEATFITFGFVCSCVLYIVLFTKLVSHWIPDCCVLIDICKYIYSISAGSNNSWIQQYAYRTVCMIHTIQLSMLIILHRDNS